MNSNFVCLLSAFFLLFAGYGVTCEVDDLDDLLGFTIIAITNVDGTFEGADYGDPVKLDNGMLFEFAEYNYAYAYHPDVAVFAKTFSMEDIKQMKLDTKFSKPITLYKLLIEDEVYDVQRIR